MPLPDPRYSRAVLIGTSEYESLPPLEAVAANVEQLHALFAAKDLWGLPPENCTVLLNPAQPGEVLAAVREAAEAAQDTLVVYFAGHGLRSPDNDELYLALRTTVKDRMFTALRYDDLRRELLHAVNVASKVVLLDCCYSGVAMRDTMSATDDVAERARIEGTYLMTASASTVLALAPQGEKHTAFTGEIIDAISTGIPDGPDTLNMEKIFWHIHGRLQAKGLPIPQQRAGNNGGMISLVRNRRGTVMEPGQAVRQVRLPDVPAGLEHTLTAAPQDLVAALRELADAEAEGLLRALIARVDVQEIAGLLDYLEFTKHRPYTHFILNAAVRGTPERLVELVATLRLLGQDRNVEALLESAVVLASGHVTQLAELARLLSDEYAAESRRLIAAGMRAAAAAGDPGDLIALVGALWSVGLGDEIDRTLRESEVDLGEVDALALARALESSGRGELAVTLYLREPEAVAVLKDEEIAAIVRTARENERAADAGELVAAALRRRNSGTRYTAFAAALLSSGLDAEADLVFDTAASQLSDEELKTFAAALRAQNRAEAAFELFRKAASHRPVESVIEFVESLRALGRPVGALRLLTESAQRKPDDLVIVLSALRELNRVAEFERFSALVLERPAVDLAQVVIGLLDNGLEDTAAQYMDVIVHSRGAEGVIILVSALYRSERESLARDFAAQLITSVAGGPARFAAWLPRAPSAGLATFVVAVVEAIDIQSSLVVARELFEAGDTDLSGDLLREVRFESTESLIAAFETANWRAGLDSFYTSKAQMSLDVVIQEYAGLVRSGHGQQARFLLEQSAMFRPADQIPEMLSRLLGSSFERTVDIVTRAVGLHRSPDDLGRILNTLNLRRGRLKRCSQAIIAAVALRSPQEVDAVAQALRRQLLEHYVQDLIKAHRSQPMR